MDKIPVQLTEILQLDIAAFDSRFDRLEHAGEEWLQHLDSRPKSRLEQAMSVINLNFDTLLVMAVLSLILLLYFPLGSIFA